MPTINGVQITFKQVMGGFFSLLATAAFAMMAFSCNSMVKARDAVMLNGAAIQEIRINVSEIKNDVKDLERKLDSHIMANPGGS